jgi:aminopeptidase N
VRSYIRRHREGNTVAADLWQALTEASGEAVSPIARAWIEQAGHPALRLEVRRREGAWRLSLRQDRFRERPARKDAREKWPIPFVARVGRGRSGSGRLVRKLVTRTRDGLDLGATRPRFVYGNAEEAGFFRPDHAPDELRALIRHHADLPALERMGLVDHQWALARAGRASVADFLDLAEVLGEETDPDVLSALRKPLAFLANALIPDAAPDAGAGFRRFAGRCFGPSLRELGWDPVRDEPAETRVRRAVLLAIVGGVAEDPDLLATAARRCRRYLNDRSSLDANLADAVVALAARNGDAALHARFVRAMQRSETPQEKRRFLLGTADFRDPKRIDATLALSLGDAVPTQDVVFLLGRLLANPAARDRTWRFVRKRWPRLRRRMPSLFASRLIDATPNLLTRDARREVASFFRENPVPSGDRALRQALERFDWYARFRTGAARDLRAWLADRPG